MLAHLQDCRSASSLPYFQLMESIDGYSYYDTPTGPQYIRNDSLDLPTTISESRQRNSPTISSASVKFHPYLQRRRVERSGTSLASEHYRSELVNHGHKEQLFSGSSCREWTSPVASSFVATGPTELYMSSEDVPRGAYTGPLMAMDDQSDAYVSEAAVIHAPPQDIEHCAVTEQDFSRSLNQQVFTTRGGSRSVAMDNGQKQTVDINDEPIKQWLDQSWYQAPQTSIADVSNELHSEFWPMAGMSSKPISKIRQGSTTSHLSSQELRTPMSNETVACQGAVSPGKSGSQDLRPGDSSLKFSMLDTEHFVSSHESVPLDIPIDETLFEYGPFFDFGVNSHQILREDSCWSSPSQPQILNHAPTVESTEGTLVLPPDESDRPMPQVALVGGYFAPEDESQIPTPPEVNSQGNIRISRLPPKRALIAYEIPAIPDMTVSQLKSELKKHGLQAVGKKSELQARLEKHLGNNQHKTQWTGS